MNTFKVLFVDDFKGSVFTFSAKYQAKGLFDTEHQAREEFPEADIIKIEMERTK